MIIRPLAVNCLLCILPLAGCTRFQLLDATIPSCGYTRLTDVPYGPNVRQKLDVYRSKHGVPAAPVVVFFYGGEWKAGSKANYRFVAEALTSRGFVAVLPDYRLYPEVTFPAFVEDGARAIRWAHDNASRFGGDPQRLYLMGHSAGAHIAALLTLDERYLKAVGLDRSAVRATAGLSGPYDINPSPDDRPVFNLPPGNSPPDPRINPVNFVDGHEPPMLLVQGQRDRLVQPAQAEELASRIRQAGGEVQLIEFPIGHGETVLSLALPFRWLAPVLRETTVFFRQH